MSKNKHLTLTERISIQQLLNESKSFRAIGTMLERDCTTISKEIKRNLIQKQTGSYGRPYNDCLKRFNCQHIYLCNNLKCNKSKCSLCRKCTGICKDYFRMFALNCLKHHMFAMDVIS